MEAKEIARRVFFTRPALKISLIGVAAPFFTDAFHRSDSGTNSWIRKVSNAGAAPASITQRHEVWVTLKYLPNTAINTKPTFAAAPITPANMGRFSRGHDSITSATPSDHSPPIPNAATNRNKPRCHGAPAK